METEILPEGGLDVSQDREIVDGVTGCGSADVGLGGAVC